MQTTHTPIPWQANKWAPGWEIGAPDSNYTICSLAGYNNEEANAQMIARAVNCHADLLEACKAILSRYESLFSGVETCDIHPTDEAVMNESRAAIAKAEGNA